MVFLLASFAAFRQLLDMGTSSAFFTFLSQKQRSAHFIRVYWFWVASQLAISLVVVWLMLPDALIGQIWVGEDRTLIALALLASFMQGLVWTSASQMAEAYRETVNLQRLNTLVVCVHLCVMVALWHLDQLAIPLVFTALIIEWGIAAWLASRMYRTQGVPRQNEHGTVKTLSAIVSEYFRYCGPMIPYVWLAFAHDFADRWMLQAWGGASEQAYYGVAQQFSAVALLATSSILGVLWKEVAEAAHRNDLQRLSYLYSKVSRILYFVASATACGLLPWSNELLALTVGEDYSGGAVTLMLMLLYPIHQSLGQIGGTLLYATENVRLQVKLNVFVMATSLVFAYVMMAPPDAFIPGLNLRSGGLAWKMLIVQAVSVNLLMWFIARSFDWKFHWQFQYVVFGVCFTLGWVMHQIAALLLEDISSTSVKIILATFCYGLTLLFVVVARPSIAGLLPTELDRILRFKKSIRR